MCRPDWEIVRFVPTADPAGRPRLGVRLPEGVLDLQAAHVALRGAPSPHLRDAFSFRLAAAFGLELAQDLVRRAPREALTPHDALRLT